MVSQNAIIAAFSSTTLISIAPNILLFLFPKYGSGEGEHSALLSLGQAIAAGGLLGDVFLHVIPHSTSSSLGGHGNSNHNVGLWILLGFSIFLLADMILRSIGGHQHEHHHHDSSKKSDKKENKHEQRTSEHKTSTVLLNLAADALHNVSLFCCCCCCYHGFFLTNL
jgi:zinc transporter 7